MQNLIQQIQDKVNKVVENGDREFIKIPFQDEFILISIEKIKIIDAKISYPKLEYKEFD